MDNRTGLGRQLQAPPGLPATCRAMRAEDGLSLVELLVTMIVLIVVLLAIYGTWSRLESTYAFTADDMLAQEEARAAMGEMVEYIRTAREPAPALVIDDNGEALPGLQHVIVYASSTEIQFWADIDRDIGHTLELVQYRVADGGLFRDTDPPPYTDPPRFEGPTRMVTAHVTNDAGTALFSYDATVTSVADLSRIREVTIDLRIDIFKDRAPVSHRLTSIVQPRNLRQQ